MQQHALDLARTHQRQQQLAGMHAALGVAHSEARNHDPAIAHYQTAMELAEQQDNAVLQLPIQYNLGLTLRGAGKPERAREIFMNLVEPLQDPGLDIRLASLYSVLGSIARELGETSQARQWLELSEALHADLDNPAEYTAPLIDRVRLEMAQDSLSLAKPYADRALEEARRADYYFSLRGAWAVNVDLLSRLDNRAGALGSAPKVLMLIDLDHFKLVNDTCGHGTGDRALKQVADTLRRFAESAGGQVGRWGGEEFMLLFPLDAPEQAAQLASRLVATVRDIQSVCPRAGSVSLTASAGFAPLDGVVRDSGQKRWEPAFVIADRMLYRVKAKGRNGWLGVWPLRGNLLEPHRINEQIENRECRLLGDEPAAG